MHHPHQVFECGLRIARGQQGFGAVFVSPAVAFVCFQHRVEVVDCRFVLFALQVDFGQIKVQGVFLGLHIKACQERGVGETQIPFGEVILTFEIRPLEALIVNGQAGKVRRAFASAEGCRERQ